MAFKRITMIDIWDIIRRRHDGQSITAIADVTGYDRKTLRKYFHQLQAHGIVLVPGVPLDKDHILSVVEKIVTVTERTANKQAVFVPYLKELIELVAEQGLKRKTAFSVLCQRHDLTAGEAVSYSSFKRFTQQHRGVLVGAKDLSTCRIEVEPGSQLQVDYCKAGLLPDPELPGTMRVVYAFIATLSFSRHKYIEFTFRQTQQHFVQSHINAFHFFGAVPKTVVLDNLKAGVITPSLYDPQFNRGYREMAEYYECFLDPARVAHPKDKPKVERDVQTVREKFKELKAITPTITVAELNHKVLLWLKDGYGMARHGTTHQKPFPLFSEQELPAMLPLPQEPFEPAFWKEATVHPDHYIQVQGKFYSVPHAYVGKKVWAKSTHRTLQIHYNEQIIKVHSIPEGRRQTDLEDFPEHLRHAIDRGLPRHLQQEATKIGPHFTNWVCTILRIHAMMNLRCVQGLLRVATKYPAELIEETVVAIAPRTAIAPKHFKAMVENVARQRDEQLRLELPRSEQTHQFIRTMNYFDHTVITEGEPYVPGSTTHHAIENPQTLRHGSILGSEDHGSAA